MTGGDAHPETRRMMETAIRRLNALEYVILGFAMALALVAGALAAWMVENLAGAPFRLTWALSSLLFFVVPGFVVFRRERRASRVRKDDAVTAGEAGAVRSGTAATGTDATTARTDTTGTEGAGATGAATAGTDTTGAATAGTDTTGAVDTTEMRDHGGR